MAKTNKDSMLRVRIESLFKQLIGSDKEIIYQIACICGISYRTAYEHFHTIKAQQTLIDYGFKENCTHDWSVAFSTPGGLVKQCKLCYETKKIILKEIEESGL